MKAIFSQWHIVTLYKTLCIKQKLYFNKSASYVTLRSYRTWR